VVGLVGLDLGARSLVRVRVWVRVRVRG